MIIEEKHKVAVCDICRERSEYYVQTCAVCGRHLCSKHYECFEHHITEQSKARKLYRSVQQVTKVVCHDCLKEPIEKLVLGKEGDYHRNHEM